MLLHESVSIFSFFDKSIYKMLFFKYRLYLYCEILFRYIDEFLFLNILIDTKSQPSLQVQDNEHNSIKKEPQATNLYLIVWGSRFYILNYSNKL